MTSNDMTSTGYDDLDTEMVKVQLLKARARQLLDEAAGMLGPKNMADDVIRAEVDALLGRAETLGRAAEATLEYIRAEKERRDNERRQQ